MGIHQVLFFPLKALMDKDVGSSLKVLNSSFRFWVGTRYTNALTHMGLGVPGGSYQCLSGPYASLPSSICLRLLKTSRTLAEKLFAKRSRPGVGDIYLKSEVDESRTKCKETDSYLFTFFDGKLCKSCTV